MSSSENNADPPRRFNAATGRYYRHLIFVENLPADNPMQSEECSHIGLAGNRECRRCDVNTSLESLSTEGGYESLFNVSNVSRLLHLPNPFDSSHKHPDLRQIRRPKS
jgi:hypothetical protein